MAGDLHIEIDVSLYIQWQFFISPAQPLCIVHIWVWKSEKAKVSFFLFIRCGAVEIVHKIRHFHRFFSFDRALNISTHSSVNNWGLAAEAHCVHFSTHVELQASSFMGYNYLEQSPFFYF